MNHFGNSEVRWLENLLYLYTNPADIIVDPFAGSGAARRIQPAGTPSYRGSMAPTAELPGESWVIPQP